MDCKPYQMVRKYILTNNNIFLLLSIILLICSSFLIHDHIQHKIQNSILFSAVLLLASSSISGTRPRLIYITMGVIVLREISAYLVQNDYFYTLATIVSVIFFINIVIQLIRQVARSRDVDNTVILEAVNAYLLMGLSASILFALVDRIQGPAFSYAHAAELRFSDFIYFGFITQTTIGYGEITPLTDLAKLLTISIGICGQLYIGIIIAMLVGKYLAQNSR